MSKSPFPSIVRATCLVLALAITGAACGSSGAAKPGAETLTCKDPSDSTLGSDPICLDSGVRAKDLFTFSNWAGRRYAADDFGFTEMIGLYGSKNVCGTNEVTTCVPLPKAKVVRTLLDSMLKNGRCEGISVLGALYMTGRGPDPKSFDATDVRSLNPRSAQLNDIIDYWWSTQLTKKYISYSKDVRKGGVEAVLNEVIDGLNNKTGVTVGIFQNNAGHSILPVALSRHSESQYYVYVWDSNHPSSLGRLMLDIKEKKWSYSGGRTSPSDSAKLWEGTDGSIDAGPLSSRSGDAVVNIGDSKGSSTVVASASAGKTLSVKVTTSDGKSLVASSTGTTGVIDGVNVHPSRNGDATQILIDIPATVQQFTVSSSVSGTSASTNTTDQLAVNPSVGSPLTVSIPSSNANSTTEIGLSAASGTTVNSTAAATINTAASASAIELKIGANESAQIVAANDSTASTAVTITSSTGQQSTTTISAPTSGSQDVSLVSNGDGALRKTATTAAPVVIDSKNLAAITDTVSVVQTSSGIKVTTTVGKITAKSALVSSTVVAPTDINYQVEYGQMNGATTQKTPKQFVVYSPDAASAVTAPLNGLSPSTQYRYRTIVQSSGIPLVSNWATFSTTDSSATQTVQTGPATTTTNPSPVVSTPDGTINVKIGIFDINTTSTTASILSRIVTPSPNVAFYMEYGIDNDGSLSRTTTVKYEITDGIRAVTTDLENLQPNTRYRIRDTMIGPGNSYTWTTNFRTFVTDPIAPRNISVTGGDASIIANWSLPANPSSESLRFTATANDGSTCTVVDDTSCEISDLNRFQTYTVTVTTTVISTGVTSARSAAQSVIAALPSIQSFGAGRPTSTGFSARNSFIAAGYTYTYILQIRVAGTTSVIRTVQGSNGDEIDPTTDGQCADGPNGLYCTKSDNVDGLNSGTTYEVRMVVSANNSTYRSDWSTVTTQ